MAGRVRTMYSQPLQDCTKLALLTHDAIVADDAETEAGVPSPEARTAPDKGTCRHGGCAALFVVMLDDIAKKCTGTGRGLHLP